MEMRDFRLERSIDHGKHRNRKTMKLLASDEGLDVVRTVRVASAAGPGHRIVESSLVRLRNEGVYRDFRLIPGECIQAASVFGLTCGQLPHPLNIR
jgi:hypothetical protein